MSAFETVLSRARKVRRTGHGTAIISCPAPDHADRHPSCTVREVPDGKVLLNCRSRGCTFEAMAAGLGMRPQEFFPPRQPGTPYTPKALSSPAADILAALADELLLGYLAISDLVRFVMSDRDPEMGRYPTPETMRRLLATVLRVRAGAEEATGSAVDVEAERDEILRAAQLTPEEEKQLAEIA